METVNKYRKMMGNYNSIMYSMALMGVLIGFAVIYTSSLISFEELKREILTMMTLGLSSKESLEVISVEQWFLSIGGILLGIPMTIAVSKMMTTAMASELYSIPDFVDIKSIFFSIILTFIAVIFSSYTMHRKLKKLKLIDMLRERE
jgi:putative ABC transport system permease protein